VSVVASDLVQYHAATQSDVDATPVGGAIDTLRRPDFTQVTAGDTVEVISNNAGDTQNCTIEARKADGTIVSETLALTGVAAKIFAGNGAIDRILKVELASNAVGSVTVRKSVAGATYRVIPAGERGFSMVMRKGSSSTSGGVNYFAKTFWKNTNGVNALLGATISESADPAGVMTHGVATAVNDSGTAANRQTAPAGVTIDGTAKSIPGTDLAAGAAIGLWMQMTLAISNVAIKSTYTSQIAGSTT
jgi:hypothetical protein